MVGETICSDRTDAYDLEDAINDGYLVPPKAVSVPLKFPTMGINYDDLSDEEKEQWDAIEWDEEDDKGPLSIGQIIGYLIHHDVLMIFRCGVRFRMFQKWAKGTSREEFFKNVETEIQQTAFSEPISPHISFQSDRSEGLRLINLVTFLEAFSDKILLEILKTNHWLQDDLFKDLDMTEEDARRVLSRFSK